MRFLKYSVLGIFGLLLAVLTTATVIEKIYGTKVAHAAVYSSVPFVILWGFLVFFSVWYMLRRRLYRQPAAFFLHLSFIVILAGASVTRKFGSRGQIEIEYDKSEKTFADRNGNSCTMPFELTLNNFEIVYYEGTCTPMDFISRFSINDSGSITEAEVSMNRIFSYRHYRFCQAGYDANGKGTILSVSHDPWGIGITYAGYILLLLSMISFFFEKNSTFRHLLKLAAASRKVAAIVLCLGLDLSVQAEASSDRLPDTFPKEYAKKFGQLRMLYNDRVCPVQTFARDFTVKMYGKPFYRGLSPEQVLTGWLFFYDSWEDEPFIKIRSRDAREVLGIEGRYACLSDYFGGRGRIKTDAALDSLMTGKRSGDRRGIEEAGEKLNIISMLCAGTMLKIFPDATNSSAGTLWYAQNSELPDNLTYEERLFIRKSMDYIYELSLGNRYEEIASILGKIGIRQKKQLGRDDEFRFCCEKIYNSINFTKGLAIFCTVTGILSFLFFCIRLSSGKSTDKRIKTGMTVLMVLVFIYLTLLIAMRGIVSGHVPLSNGYETMLFMSWSAMLLTLLFCKKFSPALPFGFLISGLSLMVSMMGGTNPQITQLMPVLSSPLLSIHVMVIMTAYSLLAFTMFVGLTAIILNCSRHDRKEEIMRLKTVSGIILYPAIFLLITGIFTGAVWANVSWGRYWGWDPKETWALITMLIYSLALHGRSLSMFRKPMFFHIFCVLAFLSVLFTYFGVNFLLGGMHSYA